jgi:sugar/nucleoside kinase (ribokinase family)
MFEPGSWSRMREAIPPSVLTAADTQTSDIAWGNILDFAGAHLLFANEREARFAVGDRWSPLEAIARRLWTRAHLAGTEALFLKRGADGLSVYHQGPTLHVPACAVQPITDPIGAGDALMAYATLTYAATKDLALAARVGSAAAAVACAQEGNAPVAPAAIRARWSEW